MSGSFWSPTQQVSPWYSILDPLLKNDLTQHKHFFFVVVLFVFQHSPTLLHRLSSLENKTKKYTVVRLFFFFFNLPQRRRAQ